MRVRWSRPNQASLHWATWASLVAAVTLPDRRVVLATTSPSGLTVELWDALSGQPWGKPLAAAGQAKVLAVVADAAGVERLAVGGSDGSVRLWDVENGVEVGAPRTGHDRGVTSIVALPGAAMAVAAHDGSVRVWDVDGDGPPRIARKPGAYTQEFRLRTVVSSGGTARTAFSQSYVGTDVEDTVTRVYAGVWDASADFPTGHQVSSSRWGSTDVAGWRDAGGTDWLVFAGAEVEFCDAADGRLHRRNWGLGHVAAVVTFAGPEGTPWLAAAGRDGTIRLVDLVTGKPAGPPLTGPPEHTASITAFRAPGGRLMLAAGYSDAVRVWDLTGTEDDDALPPTGHSGRVTVRASPAPDDGAPALVATYGDGDQTIRLWDQATGESAGEPMKANDRNLTSAVRAPLIWVPGFAVACGTYLKGLRRFSARTGKAQPWPRRAPLGRAPGHSRDAIPVGADLLATVFSHDYHRSSVRIWNATTGRPLRRWGRPVRFRLPKDVHAITVLTGPDGRTLIAACPPDRVRLWNALTGGRVRVPAHGSEAAGSSRLVAAFSTEDGDVLLAAVYGKTAVRVWNPRTGDLAAEPDSGHSSEIHAVVALPGSPGRVASGDRDGTVRIWEPLTGATAGVLETGAPIHDLSVGPAGTLFVAGPGGLTAVDV
ncbi:hypothetical protein ACTI_74340 [Actinoplanes sp. OR16]|uniref:WD40 repeat domain-containing protein n=1 Tax=Actinoplanes sp. OR16 TaxID=946334 RepID=UPI000F6CB921|nr:hypothetical protein [Actinoplanes sp. OR16]BBH70749.1 hypothetical protein ACTI_74340 [Actinoplanes sp. OR16]